MLLLQGRTPQELVVVGGSGVKAISNVASPLRPLSINRVGTGVANLVPATPKVTRAEESPSAIRKTHGNRNGKTGDKDRTNQKVVDTVQAEKSPGRVDLK